jgi:hypothetical protein
LHNGIDRHLGIGRCEACSRPADAHQKKQELALFFPSTQELPHQLRDVVRFGVQRKMPGIEHANLRARDIPTPES